MPMALNASGRSANSHTWDERSGVRGVGGGAAFQELPFGRTSSGWAPAEWAPATLFMFKSPSTSFLSVYQFEARNSRTWVHEVGGKGVVGTYPCPFTVRLFPAHLAHLDHILHPRAIRPQFCSLGGGVSGTSTPDGDGPPGNSAGCMELGMGESMKKTCEMMKSAMLVRASQPRVLRVPGPLSSPSPRPLSPLKKRFEGHARGLEEAAKS